MDSEKTGPRPLTDAREGRRLSGMRTPELSVLVMAAVIAPVSWAQVPVFEINRAESSIKFNVKASVEIAGTFEKWSASVKFRSPELTGYPDPSGECAYRKRRKGRKAERERFLRCGAESHQGR
jgi:hypothetical protein